MPFYVKSFKLLSCFIKLNLCSLSFSHLFIKLLLFFRNEYSQILNLKLQFFNLSFICSTVFLKCEMIFFLLPCCKRPLLKFFLIPVHLKFELVHFFISFKDHILNIVKSILKIGCNCIKPFKIICMPS